MPYKSEPCSLCGAAMWQSPTYVSGVSKCQSCRREGWAHGDLIKYDKGKCRCDLCREAKRLAMRRYTDQRKAQGNPVPWQSYKRRTEKQCPTCGKSFLSRNDQSVCSRACNPNNQLRNTRKTRLKRMTSEGRAFLLRAEKVSVLAAMGTSGGGLIWVQGPCGVCGKGFMSRGVSSRYCSKECRAVVRSLKTEWIDWRTRRMIYIRDRWKCQLCDRPSLLGAKDNSRPTLDHIVPRSKGGSHDPSNLRLLCSRCNSKRGDLTYFSDEDVRRAFSA